MTEGYASRPTITIDGLPLDPSLVPLIESVEVDDHMQLPDRFEIVFLDRNGETLTKTRARIGSAVRISGTRRGDTAETLLIHGEVTALEGAFSQGARIIINDMRALKGAIINLRGW